MEERSHTGALCCKMPNGLYHSPCKGGGRIVRKQARLLLAGLPIFCCMLSNGMAARIACARVGAADSVTGSLSAPNIYQQAWRGTDAAVRRIGAFLAEAVDDVRTFFVAGDARQTLDVMTQSINDTAVRLFKPFATALLALWSRIASPGAVTPDLLSIWILWFLVALVLLILILALRPRRKARRKRLPHVTQTSSQPVANSIEFGLVEPGPRTTTASTGTRPPPVIPSTPSQTLPPAQPDTLPPSTTEQAAPSASLPPLPEISLQPLGLFEATGLAPIPRSVEALSDASSSELLYATPGIPVVAITPLEQPEPAETVLPSTDETSTPEPEGSSQTPVGSETAPLPLSPLGAGVSADSREDIEVMAEPIEEQLPDELVRLVSDIGSVAEVAPAEPAISSSAIQEAAGVPAADTLIGAGEPVPEPSAPAPSPADEAETENMLTPTLQPEMIPLDRPRQESKPVPAETECENTSSASKQNVEPEGPVETAPVPETAASSPVESADDVLSRMLMEQEPRDTPASAPEAAPDGSLPTAAAGAAASLSSMLEPAPPSIFVGDVDIDALLPEGVVTDASALVQLFRGGYRSRIGKLAISAKDLQNVPDDIRSVVKVSIVALSPIEHAIARDLALRLKAPGFVGEALLVARKMGYQTYLTSHLNVSRTYKDVGIVEIIALREPESSGSAQGFVSST
jgi:hypothetical protein